MAPRIDKYRQSLTKASSETVLHPAEVAVLLYDSARRKAPARGIEFDIEVGDVIQAVEKGVCPRTGREYDMRRGLFLENRCSLDRVVNHIGYVEGNWEVVVSHYNRAKSIYSTETLQALAVDILRAAGYTILEPEAELGGRR